MDRKERLQSESLIGKRAVAIIFCLFIEAHPESVSFSGT